MKTALWEVYLDECSNSDGIPYPHKMRDEYYQNLTRLINTCREKDIPTIAIYNESSYQHIDEEFENFIIKNIIEHKNPYMNVRDYDILEDATFDLPDNRPIKEYYGLILTVGRYDNVGLMRPKTPDNSPSSLIDDMERSGIEEVVVVGAHLDECIPDVIQTYLKDKFTVKVPYDATHNINDYATSIEMLSKMGIGVMRTDDLILEIG